METKAAIERFGSVRALAEALNISAQAVHQWGDFVPKLRAYELRDLMKEVRMKHAAPKRANGQ